MKDTALYQYLLGLKSPWTVSRVTLDVQGQRVDVWAEHPEDTVRFLLHRGQDSPASRTRFSCIADSVLLERGQAVGMT